MTKTENNPLLKVDGLRTYFPIRKGLLKRTVGWVKAVDGVSFQIQKGTALGLVGESGCGKTTLAKTILGLIPATAGSVYFDGIDVLARQRPQMKRLRRRMQIIFQDPKGSLNPRMTVGAIIAEPIRVHRLTGRGQVQSRVAELLDMVGLWPGCACRFPHEFSAGQRQRISIARALALEPELIICDEPVSALDISVRLQIINLLQDLRERLRLGLLFIAHDLSVVELLSDYVAVMYMGRIVEYAQKERLFQNPLHPYTRLLLSSVPVPDPKKIHRPVVPSAEVASSSNPPAGCVFSPRCPLAEGRCRLEAQELKSEEYGHFVACRRA